MKTSPNTENIFDLWIFHIKSIIFMMASSFSWTSMFLFLLHAERKSIIQACAGNWRMTQSMTTAKCFNVLNGIFISVPHDMGLHFLPNTRCPQDETEALQEMNPPKCITSWIKSATFLKPANVIKSLQNRRSSRCRGDEIGQRSWVFPPDFIDKNIKLFLYLIKGLKSTPSAFPYGASLWFVIQRDISAEWNCSTPHVARSWMLNTELEPNNKLTKAN